MTTAAVTRSRPIVERPILACLVLVFGAFVTATATLAGNGNIVIAVVPVLLATGAYAMYRLPVRYGFMALVFLSLGIDAVGDSVSDTPFARLGSLLAINLNKTIPIGALSFPGAAVLLAAMILLLVQRSLSGSRMDSLGRTPAARPMFAGLAVSFLAVLGVIGIGTLRGGDVQMAKVQVQTFVTLLVIAYVAAMSLRGVQDYRTLGRLIVAAAILRSVHIISVAHHFDTYVLASGEELHAAGTHGDSLLLAAAAVLLVVRFAEKPSRRIAVWCAVLMPVLLLAMQMNNRRIVWVEFVGGVMVYAMLSRRSAVKRFALRAALVCLPLFAGYVVAGWNSQSKIFAPIQMYRSVTDGEVDSSTLYRDLENYNLMMTMRLNPVMGTGFGLPFVEEVKLPDISFFKEYRYLPHNSFLGLWAFAGPFGFTGLTSALFIAIYLAIRSYNLAQSPEERIAALMVPAVITIYFAHCWGDIGFSERRTAYLVGPVLAIAGQLAYRTGAYQSRRPRADAGQGRG